MLIHIYTDVHIDTNIFINTCMYTYNHMLYTCVHTGHTLIRVTLDS